MSFKPIWEKICISSVPENLPIFINNIAQGIKTKADRPAPKANHPAYLNPSTKTVFSLIVFLLISKYLIKVDVYKRQE